MTFSIRLHPDAEAKINEAAAFLNLESPGLGEVLLNVVGSEIRILAVSHQRRRPFYWSSRRYPLLEKKKC